MNDAWSVFSMSTFQPQKPTIASAKRDRYGVSEEKYIVLFWKNDKKRSKLDSKRKDVSSIPLNRTNCTFDFAFAVCVYLHSTVIGRGTNHDAQFGFEIAL